MTYHAKGTGHGAAPDSGNVRGTPCGRREFLATSALGLGALMSACRSGTAPLIAPHATLRSRPRMPTGTIALGYTSLGIGNPLIGRDAVLHVPANYDPATPAPLLVMLHGTAGGGDDWSSEEFRAIVDPLGIIVLAPDSRSYGSWDLLEDGDYARDVEFIDDALAWTFARCRVDPSRITIGGFSDGASESLGLGVVNGDLFSAILGFSPGALHAPHQRGAPRAFLSHGTADAVLPFAYTRDEIVPAMRDAGLAVEFVAFDGNHELPLEVASQAFAWLAAEPLTA